jgi:hypothetical protein
METTEELLNLDKISFFFYSKPPRTCLQVLRELLFSLMKFKYDNGANF